ncbi:spore coat protein [Alsobacter soli]|uniref:Spore coat protein n=1 Tax=Alsobacter soli TaxID=2109933 RepID=A0A2T1HQC0_9HYPH|nr:glycosyltransferase family protein [Alsobacter soli]PSC03719.1 spore coat protein [Alsobacter soli]
MILAVLQARFSSSRLPGKVLEPLAGQPMLLRQLERVRRSRRIDRLVLATSVDPSDDPVADLGRRAGVDVSRGSLDDVLDRFIRAAQPFHPEWVVRLTGDCPLADPDVIDGVIEAAIAAEADYASNAVEPTWPDGLDVEVVRWTVLQVVAAEPRTEAEREHVTLAIHRRPSRFKVTHVRQQRDLSSLRWTVDEPRDLVFVRAVYDRLFAANPAFNTEDVLALLAREPQLASMNGDITRNEGLLRSLAAESAPT